jgi:hypothetical protein
VLVSESGIAVDDRFGRESGRMYLTGIQPLAGLPVDSRRADLRSRARAGNHSAIPEKT